MEAIQGEEGWAVCYELEASDPTFIFTINS